MDLNKKLEQVCREFCIEGTYVGYETIQVGNVNRTYEVKFLLEDGSPKSFLVQNVNTYVFKNPIQVMENIDKVTEHIRAKKPGQLALHFHHTRDRKTYIIDGENFWRMTNFIPSVNLSVAGDREVVYNAGKAFGEFQVQLSDFPAEQLHETIAGFHDTRARFEKLFADEEADPCGKVAEVREELEYLRRVQDLACKMTDMCRAGQLPVRVTHNDTKINNVLFSQQTREALVVIDLDTVMPGLVGHDFGDAIRFAANRVAEDSPEYDKAGVDMEVFAAFTEGFLSQTAGMLTKNEIDTLALSCFVLTTELATRFLDDYILGSPYFKINYPEHNLVRARCQIALAQDMELRMPEMQACVARCAAGVNK